MNKRKDFKRDILISLFAIGLAVVVALLSGSLSKEPELTRETVYTVQEGDTLYSIAAEFGIMNWRAWAYETCQENGIEHGGMIYPGQELVIKH